MNFAALLALRSTLALVCSSAPLCAQYLLHQTLGATPGGRLGAAITGISDLDGDQVPDILVAQPANGGGGSGNGAVFAVSGATKQTLYGVPVRLGISAALQPLGDVDGDTRPDFGVAATVSSYETLQVRSGASGALLRTHGSASLPALGPACSVGDLDADGRSEYAIVLSISNVKHVALVHGATGSQLNLVTTWNTDRTITRLHAVGDWSGDGKSEVVAVVSGGLAALLDVANGSLRRTLGPTGVGSGFGSGSAIGDVTGDGKPELVVVDAQAVLPVGRQGGAFVYALASGALLRTLFVPLGADTSASRLEGRIEALSDLDADGAMDFALLETGTSSGGCVRILSGGSGRSLTTWPAFHPVDYFYAVLASVDDVNGDADRELLLGVSNFYANESGAWQIVSGRILASAVVAPVACHGGPFPPQLGISRPVIGQPMHLAGRDAPPSAQGLVLLGPVAPWPLFLGAPGCLAYADLSGAVVLHAPPPGTTWTHSFAIPATATLAGFHFAVQAFYAPTLGPLRFDASHAVVGRVGF